jgi:hypothetical protein
MGLKLITVKESLQLIAEKYPEPVELCVIIRSKDKVNLNFTINSACDLQQASYIAVEVPDKYRYMTQQEFYDWCCTKGSSGYQVQADDEIWMHPVHRYYDKSNNRKYRYRTIQEIDGNIVYGEPQEFKIKV